MSGPCRRALPAGQQRRRGRGAPGPSPSRRSCAGCWRGCRRWRGCWSCCPAAGAVQQAFAIEEVVTSMRPLVRQARVPPGHASSLPRPPGSPCCSASHNNTCSSLRPPKPWSNARCNPIYCSSPLLLHPLHAPPTWMLLAFTSWQASSRMSLGMSAIVLPAAMRQTLQHTHTHSHSHTH